MTNRRSPREEKVHDQCLSLPTLHNYIVEERELEKRGIGTDTDDFIDIFDQSKDEYDCNSPFSSPTIIRWAEMTNHIRYLLDEEENEEGLQHEGKILEIKSRPTYGTKASNVLTQLHMIYVCKIDTIK